MVSVCMATFNGELYIFDQLQSILKQLSHEDEVIISDDSSTDSTVAIINSFNDERIKLFENQKFKSAVLNFQFTLYQAKGDYVFLADQDDVWLSDRVSTMLEHLQQHKLVVCNCKFIDEKGFSLHPKSFFNIYNSGPGVIKNFVKNTYIGNCMAFNRDILNFALPFPKAIDFYPNIDHGMWIGILVNVFYTADFIPSILVLYRRHEKNVSPTNIEGKSPYSLKIKVLSRFSLGFYLLQRALSHAFKKIH
ncbi:glycosyltransferase [Spirosoma sp. 209]|uniref:glycosyltransferase n=1 Tax=Spirosoma sp. 209 TaxID=1955701 RepID=UPI00098D420C|nr:glycosyltransferase [Spirosoma sp. 209]